MATNKKYQLLAEKLRIRYSDKFDKPQVAIKQKNFKSGGFTTIATLGNFSVVTGKAKSRKSFYVGIALAAAISDNIILGTFKSNLPKKKREVVYFDTEQGKYHVQKALHRICKQAKIENPENLAVYCLRGLNYKKRHKVIEEVIYTNPNIGLVVIDGVRDLVTSINDEQQATEISSKLLKWTEELNIHIIVVLHQNKGNAFARGHLGTELINKAELVLSVTKPNNNEDISIVKADYSRDIAPENFAFTIVDGLPTVIDSYVDQLGVSNRKPKLKDLNDEDKIKLLKEVFSKENGYKYGELKKQIQSSYIALFKESIGLNQAVYFITECKSKRWIDQDKPKGKYSLSSSLEPP
ncbi:mobilization protein [Hyunsoonleella flava]|uniref:Mobilization protein n=1 Tax=Hyunsoonleella flava TaxID=2527939 RepID=A0A4V2JA12_9FLAO|nr:AAA family ATPase [Hyunsoonleella flava]TBN03218.1 mobilization protein [Hyunsoonleella flava]